MSSNYIPFPAMGKQHYGRELRITSNKACSIKTCDFSQDRCEPHELDSLECEALKRYHPPFNERLTGEEGVGPAAAPRRGPIDQLTPKNSKDKKGFKPE